MVDRRPGGGSFRDLIAWPKAADFAVVVYRLTESFPGSEAYGLTAQRAAVSIPANLAEGAARGTKRDFANFVSIARGSLWEVETHLELAERLQFVASTDSAPLFAATAGLGRLLTALRTRLNSPTGGGSV